MSIKANQILNTQIQTAVISTYQDKSVLGFFNAEDIGDIGVTNWLHKKLDDIPEAALTLAGFNPQSATLNAELFGHKVFTSSEDMKIDEISMAQFEKWGLDEEGVRMLGEKVAKSASLYLWTGKDAEGDIPYTQYNFILDAGADNGTTARPLIQSTATKGVWSTYTNKAYDLSLLLGQLVAKGYNLGSTVVFYAEIADTPMGLKGNAANDLSAIEYLQGRGILACIPIPDAYMTTLAGAAPAAALFDLVAIDLLEVDIGYTRTERVRIIDPYGTVRETTVEGEVWFCPYLKPRPIGTKIYKGVSRITAIAP